VKTDAHKHILTIQNATDLEFATTELADASTHVGFKRDIFPPDHRLPPLSRRPRNKVQSNNFIPEADASPITFKLRRNANGNHFCLAGLFWRFWMPLLVLLSVSLASLSGFAQTGLPLNFSTLSNPLQAPQSYYFDSDPSIPLGDKTPLILIHGIDLSSGPPSASASGWDNFCTWFYNTPSLRSRYKIYRFVYQSNQSSVQTLGDYLSQLLNANDGSATDQQLEAKDIVILAHSMGGLVARRLMEEQRPAKSAKWNQSTLRLITLATPQHGTPVANRCDYVFDPLPDYIGALGYKFKHELGTIDFAILASGVSGLNGAFHLIPNYNQPNRIDLLWDNYNGLFTGGFSSDELNPPTATLNSITSAQSYDSKIIAYAGYIASSTGHDAELSDVGDILANGLGIPSDGIVPIDSAWFQGRIANSQLRLFSDYDHYQMMRSKTSSPSDPLFTSIGNDLAKALPVIASPTITSISPATLPPLNSAQTITISGSHFQPSGTDSSTLVFYDPVNNPYTRTPYNVTTTSMQYDINVQSATGTWKVKVVNGSAESPLFNFTVASVNAQLTGLTITGPASVSKNTSVQYTGTAVYSDGTTASVTPTWGLNVSSSVATISSSGGLTAGNVGANTPVTISASYTFSGVTKTANYNINVVTGSTSYQLQELISNGTFLSGSTGWTLTGNFQADSRFSTYNNEAGYAYLANADGSAGNNLSGTLSQTVTIPANATSATLGYYYRITSSDTSGVAHDHLHLQLNYGAGTQAGLDDKSNANANTGYGYASFNLIAYKGLTVTVYFAATTDGSNPTTFRVDDVSLLVTVPIPPTPVLFGVGGPTSVPEGGSAQYNAIVVYSDGSIVPVTPSWGASGPASISSSGFLNAGSVSSDTAATVTATYSGFSTLFYNITVVNVAPVFSYLSVSGPASMNENSSSQFTASAVFSDGSSESVSPNWSVSSGPGNISSAGVLTIGSVNGNTTTTVSANYTLGSIAHSADQAVSIVYLSPPPTFTSLSINGPGSVKESTSAQYTATEWFSDGSSQIVIPTWSVNTPGAGISTFGLLTVGQVSSNTVVPIYASYTDGNTLNATNNVTVVNIPSFTATSANDGTFQTTLSGLSMGQTIVLYSSTNLNIWTPIQTNIASGSTVTFTNTINRDLQSQYFRASAQ